MRDNDHPSITALGIALIRSALEREATPTGDPAGEEALTAALLRNAPERFREWAQRKEPRRGFLEFVAARTEFFDRAVLRAIDAGIDQVVILGAGYCGRALRFRAPGVRFFEVDHPATQADKRSRLERLGVRSDDIAFVTADFTEPTLDRALDSAGHRRDEPSLFMLEGVLCYLPERWFRETEAPGLLRHLVGLPMRSNVSGQQRSSRPGQHCRGRSRTSSRSLSGSRCSRTQESQHVLHEPRREAVADLSGVTASVVRLLPHDERQTAACRAQRKLVDIGEPLPESKKTSRQVERCR